MLFLKYMEKVIILDKHRRAKYEYINPKLMIKHSKTNGKLVNLKF